MNPSPNSPRITVQLRRASRLLLALSLATALWLPCVQFVFRSRNAVPSSSGAPSDWTKAMAERHLGLWSDPASKARELERMRRSNAEWDFMGRTFFALSLAEMSLREPDRRSEYLSVVDAIIDETLRLEAANGIHFFLMPYSRSQPYIVEPARSLFLDGEIALMIAARRLVEEKPGYREELARRVGVMETQLRQNRFLVGESYPDECWIFDHAMALAAVRMADRLDGTDHRALFDGWLRVAKEKLVDPKTGLLVSSFTTRAEPLDGPEGSSIWVTAHCLRLLDESFARDQYERAKRELGRELLGFAWSREWPETWTGPSDIDSGAVIPGLNVSAGGSGLAFTAAHSFGDDDFFAKLRTTLDFAAFPRRDATGLRYCASNQVGDAALLYAAVLGPLWDRTLLAPTPTPIAQIP